MAELIPCSVEGCEKPKKIRGWCHMHYDRWYVHGDVGGSAPLAMRGRVCSVDGCSRPHLAKGLCSLHFQRQKKDGHPGEAAPRYGRGETARYMAVHERHRKSIQGQSCVHADETCKGRIEAALRHDTPSELLKTERIGDHAGMKFSTNTAHYMALCQSHHSRYDVARRRAT